MQYFLFNVTCLWVGNLNTGLKKDFALKGSKNLTYFVKINICNQTYALPLSSVRGHDGMLVTSCIYHHTINNPLVVKTRQTIPSYLPISRNKQSFIVQSVSTIKKRNFDTFHIIIANDFHSLII